MWRASAIFCFCPSEKQETVLAKFPQHLFFNRNKGPRFVQTAFAQRVRSPALYLRFRKAPHSSAKDAAYSRFPANSTVKCFPTFLPFCLRRNGCSIRQNRPTVRFSKSKQNLDERRFSSAAVPTNAIFSPFSSENRYPVRLSSP